MTKQQPKITKPVVYSHERLLDALYFFWDAFERSSLNFFLTKDTARQVKRGELLSGDKLTIGIRRNEWVGGNDRVFSAFLDHSVVLHTTPDKNHVLFDYRGIPVELTLYDNNPCLDSLDPIFYQNESFYTPNPLEVFSAKYDN